MNDNQKKLIFAFVLISIITSLVLPVLLVYKTSYIEPITARASAVGSVNLSVASGVCGDGTCDAGSETCSTCAADCGTCAASSGDTGGAGGGSGGGGGGAGGLANKYVTHMLDFRLNDWYVLTLFKGDKVITVFDDKIAYKFIISELIVYDHITLKLEGSGSSYLIKWGEKGLFDFDNDKIDDLEITFLDKQVKWLNLGAEIEEPTLFPTFDKEPYKAAEGVQLGKIVKRFDFIILIIALLVIGLAIFIYHQIRIHNLESRYTNQISKLSKSYVKTKLDKGERSEFKSKLDKQKKALREAYSSKYIGKDAYEKGMSRLNELSRKT